MTQDELIEVVDELRNMSTEEYESYVKECCDLMDKEDKGGEIDADV